MLLFVQVLFVVDCFSHFSSRGESICFSVLISCLKARRLRQYLIIIDRAVTNKEDLSQFVQMLKALEQIKFHDTQRTEFDILVVKTNDVLELVLRRLITDVVVVSSDADQNCSYGVTCH
jgi:hypothetical protein